MLIKRKGSLPTEKVSNGLLQICTSCNLQLWLIECKKTDLAKYKHFSLKGKPIGVTENLPIDYVGP